MEHGESFYPSKWIMGQPPYNTLKDFFGFPIRDCRKFDVFIRGFEISHSYYESHIKWEMNLL
jgi:hypothetical protein